MRGLHALTEEDLERFCEANRVAATLHRLSVPTSTVADAAAAVGTDTGRIVKSLVFLADGEPVLAVAAGEGRVTYPLLAEALGISRKRLRFATADEALAVTGYRVGAMPPFGHRIKLPTLIDARTVPDAGTVLAGGGGVSALLELDAGDLHEVTSARRVALSKD